MVLDLTQNVAGPYAGVILAELGADVMKIEPPGGDATRQWGPPFWGGYGASYLALNRNKRGVRCDLKTEAGQNQIRAMLNNADVILVSARPGAMERLGLGWDDLHRTYPRLIYAEVTAFGHAGPLQNEPGYDPLMQALTGIMSVNSRPGEEPSRVGVSVIDMGCAQWIAIGVLAALRMRDETGEGHRVTGSLFETAIAWMTYHLTSYWASGESPHGWGSGTASISPYQAYPTSDGWLVIAAGNDRLFGILSKNLGHPEWPSDARFATNADRVRNRVELNDGISKVTRTQTTDYWQDRLKGAGIPVSRVSTTADVAHSTQLEEVGIVQSLCHPTIGNAFKSVGLPLVIDGDRPSLVRVPPL
nr:CoA transferase [Sulfobacillus harzensis]